MVARIQPQFALDNGGLLREWIDDFLESMKSHVEKADCFLRGKAPSNRLTFQLMNVDNDGGMQHYLPSKLEDMQSGDAISLTNEITNDSQANEERINILNTYTTLGKVLNYILRDHGNDVKIPSTYSSRVLIAYLINGLDGLKSMTCQELKQAANDIGFEFHTMNEYKEETFFQDFFYPVIIEPRESALAAIKSGFDIVPLNEHLQMFTFEEFESQFIGQEFFHDNDSFQEHLSFPPCHGGVVFPRFEEVVRKVLRSFNMSELKQFLKFATGSRCLHKTVSVYYKFIPIAEQSLYPNYPLPTSHTCVSSIYIPFIEVGDDDVDDTKLVAMVRENIKAGLDHGGGEFSDVNLL